MTRLLSNYSAGAEAVASVFYFVCFVYFVV
jgi:hypothetical protein